MSRVILLDNQDSFVYNLADLLYTQGHRVTVYRNSVAATEVLAHAQAESALLCLSPGPGRPDESGCLLDLIDLAEAAGVPQVGICLGFQALMLHAGARVERVGPVHGVADDVTVSPAGKEFFGDVQQASVARYHSLGSRALPSGWESWGVIGDIVMAAGCREKRQAGVQFHPESILTPGGPQILTRIIDWLTDPPRP